MVTVDDVREVARELPKTVERLVRDRVKFNVGRLVYVALSSGERTMGCGFPKQERDAAIAAEPHKFSLPGAGDQRYHWIYVDLSAIDEQELRELVTGAWRMCAPRTVIRRHEDGPSSKEPCARVTSGHDLRHPVALLDPMNSGLRAGRTGWK